MRECHRVNASDDHFDVVPRHAVGAPCPKCGGYAKEDQNGPTEDERKAYDCNRSSHHACCTRAFICNLCSYSFIARREPPEAW